MVSFIGTWMQNVAKGWLVLTLTNSPFFVGLDSAITWLPTWLVSLPAGVLADRFNKRNVMILTQSLLALFALVLAVLTWTHVITITHLLIISAFIGCVVALNAPLAQSLVPELVNRRNVLNAIALNASMFNTARIIGPALAGIVLTMTGPGTCFAINSASFLAIILALAFIQLPPPLPQSDGTVWSKMAEGVRYVAGHADIRVLVLLTGVFSSFGLVYLPLMPVFARDVFHAGPREYGLMMTCLGAGAVIGGLTLATLSRTRHRGWILAGGTAALGLLLVAFSFVRQLPLAIVLLIVIGVCQTTVSSLTNTLIQTMAPDHVRGRAMSVFTLFFNGMFPLGALIAGAIAQKAGASTAALVGGITVLACLILAAAFRPRILKL